MKVLKSSRGTEYVCNLMKRYMEQRGIEYQLKAGYAPEQNGKEESKNRTTVKKNMARSVSKFFWTEAASTVVYIINSVWNDASPYEQRMERKPTVIHLRVFSEEVLAYISKNLRKKLEDKLVESILIGYKGDVANFRVYIPQAKNIVIAHDVDFSKNKELDEPNKGGSVDCIDLNLKDETSSENIGNRAAEGVIVEKRLDGAQESKEESTQDQYKSLEK